MCSLISIKTTLEPEHSASRFLHAGAASYIPLTCKCILVIAQLGDMRLLFSVTPQLLSRTTQAVTAASQHQPWLLSKQNQLLQQQWQHQQRLHCRLVRRRAAMFHE